MTRILTALTFLFFATMALANDATKELDGAAEVIRNMAASQQIPSDVIASTECITVIPALAKAAIIVGGKHGNGVVSCRTNSGWSAPALLPSPAEAWGCKPAWNMGTWFY